MAAAATAAVPPSGRERGVRLDHREEDATAQGEGFQRRRKEGHRAASHRAADAAAAAAARLIARVVAPGPTIAAVAACSIDE
jgi:hypothetical protein